MASGIPRGQGAIPNQTQGLFDVPSDKPCWSPGRQPGLFHCEARVKRASFALAMAGRSMDTLDTIQVPSGVIQKWQEIVDLLAEVLRVPSALIMKVEPPNIKVLLRSESEGNPYEEDELAPLNTGLYCETVMSTRRLLLVPDALSDKDWNANPDIKLGMISYMGVPVTWPSGAIFGTICVLDGKPNEYNDLFRKLLFQCRDVLQADLKSLEATADLERKVLERTAELHRAQTELAHAT